MPLGGRGRYGGGGCGGGGGRGVLGLALHGVAEDLLVALVLEHELDALELGQVAPHVQALCLLLVVVVVLVVVAPAGRRWP